MSALNLRYSVFKVQDTEIYMGINPSICMSWAEQEEFFKDFDLIMSCTDVVPNLAPRLPLSWSPWIDIPGDPSNDTVYAWVRMLYMAIDERRYPKIYIHCDSSSMKRLRCLDCI